MPTTPQLSAQERYNGLAFRVLLDAIARPGSIGRLPNNVLSDRLPSIGGGPVSRPILAVMLSLLDQQTGFCIAAGGAWPAADDELMHWIALRSGARATPAAVADYVLLHDISSLPLLADLKRGSLSYPEQSASAFCLVEGFDGPPIWELRGPGIADRTAVSVRGMTAAGHAAIIDRRGEYPLGIDLYFIDPVGNCLALPRSTTISPLGTALEAAWAM